MVINSAVWLPLLCARPALGTSIIMLFTFRSNYLNIFEAMSSDRLTFLSDIKNVQAIDKETLF